MKLILFFLIFNCCLIINNIQAQIKFNDNFDDNRNNWWIGSSKEFSSSISNGKITMSLDNKGRIQYLWKTFDIDYSKDFTIKTKLKIVSGVDNHGYGLVWGASDASNLLYFIISANGQVNIYKNYNSKWQEILPWKFENSINKMYNENTLKIENINNHLYFYVNDKVIFDTKNLLGFGGYIGFCLNDIMTVEADYLEINYYPKKINLVENPLQNVIKENLGNNINSDKSDITPLISVDGKELYFVKKADTIIDGFEQDKIYYSKKQSDDKWGKAKKMGFPLNNSGHNNIVGMSADGNLLYLMNEYSDDGRKIIKGGISRSFKTIDGWSIPKAIKIDNYYNHNQYANYFFSSDNKVLILAAERDDSYGNLDLYVSFFDGEKYSEPTNLGPLVNTTQMDFSPFIASDNKTLYFASNGHLGYGGSDIYITKRLDDSWLNWSTPLNLGNGINSENWESYFILPASGEYAYMSSDENSFGNSDIVRIKLNNESKPEPVVLIKGKVLNSKTKEPLGASIRINNLKADKELGTAYSDPNTGDYKIVLPYGENYSFLANKENFYSISENLDLSKLSEYKEISKDLLLTPIEKGLTFRLNNIFFDFDKSILKEESFPELNRLVNFLNENIFLKIEIAGHTDNQGNDSYNLKLSKDRANAVLEYLISKGISRNRITSVGYGETKPISTNDNEEGRQLNRRVEVKILD
jgi:outer membrane protein OmpA-like peptidoglycan-associated protein